MITPLVHERAPKLSDAGAVNTCAGKGLQASKQMTATQHQRKQVVITISSKSEVSFYEHYARSMPEFVIHKTRFLSDFSTRSGLFGQKKNLILTQLIVVSYLVVLPEGDSIYAL